MTWIIESKNLIVAAFIIINCMSLGLMMIKCEIIYIDLIMNMRAINKIIQVKKN